jgi:hypothetical protein
MFQQQSVVAALLQQVSQHSHKASITASLAFLVHVCFSQQVLQHSRKASIISCLATFLPTNFANLIIAGAVGRRREHYRKYSAIARHHLCQTRCAIRFSDQNTIMLFCSHRNANQDKYSSLSSDELHGKCFESCSLCVQSRQ